MWSSHSFCGGPPHPTMRRRVPSCAARALSPAPPERSSRAGGGGGEQKAQGRRKNALISRRADHSAICWSCFGRAGDWLGRAVARCGAPTSRKKRLCGLHPPARLLEGGSSNKRSKTSRLCSHAHSLFFAPQQSIQKRHRALFVFLIRARAHTHLTPRKDTRPKARGVASPLCFFLEGGARVVQKEKKHLRCARRPWRPAPLYTPPKTARSARGHCPPFPPASLFGH